MQETLDLGRIVVLALADSVNPCAIAILTMVLLTVLTSDPTKKKKVLLSGLAFISSIMIGYLFYGIVIVQLFKTIGEFISHYSIYLYNGLAIFAMLMGGLQIKDFFLYKKGSFGTEMPLWMRPKAKKVINNITSPRGAFIIGFLVTVFLLPCTIGPYIIASALLSPLGILQSIPWLILYNFIFVIPMFIIVLIVYYGIKKVDEVSGWKEKNIKILHLIAGILLFLVGFSLLIGFI
ncbi:hypothetical protein HOD88_03440 [archaeon]|jgi:cytochrome c biogenesis protein CcdA|nr:hypothetical protein [archaeon]